MARDGLRLLLCAVIGCAALPCQAAAPDDDAEARLRNQLAVQAALQQGLDHLQRGNYQAAVYVLESQLARIDGNRQYLAALRDAYRGYVRELQQSNRQAEANGRQRRGQPAHLRCRPSHLRLSGPRSDAHQHQAAVLAGAGAATHKIRPTA